MQQISTGKVKFFNKQKGFGFIVQDGQNNDLFFHITECVSHEPKEGEKVEFHVKDGKRGLKAVQVTRIN